MHFALRNANRDYVLLSGEEEDAEKGGPQRRPVSAARLFGLARGEWGPLTLATLMLLLASLAQVGRAAWQAHEHSSRAAQCQCLMPLFPARAPCRQRGGGPAPRLLRTRAAQSAAPSSAAPHSG